MIIRMLGATVLMIFAGTLSLAEVRNPEYSVICRLQKRVRTLRVEKINDGTCRTVYTKAGQDQNIGNAQFSASCQDILNKVREVLEKADWKCREVKESRVSNLIDLR